MTAAIAHETSRMRAQIVSLRAELEHAAEIRRTQADKIKALEVELKTTRAELDDAVSVGTGFATLGRALPTHGGFGHAPATLLPDQPNPIE